MLVLVPEGGGHTLFLAGFLERRCLGHRWQTQMLSDTSSSTYPRFPRSQGAAPRPPQSKCRLCLISGCARHTWASHCIQQTHTTAIESLKPLDRCQRGQRLDRETTAAERQSLCVELASEPAPLVDTRAAGFRCPYGPTHISREAPWLSLLLARRCDQAQHTKNPKRGGSR